ncbi:MAG: 30S ribosomal protein S16 [Patescibacteria group bacterium]|nr:30S ribosomal protein S16 [Patescibacteria group bacterium]MDE2438057.1 30S ribosomal protein S16 [Patescibacteria group bacterium]
MLRIRLNRVGKKHQATYRVVVLPQRSKPRGGKVNEDLGWWNPHTGTHALSEDRAQYWLHQGAKPSDTVYNLFVHAGIVRGAKRPVHNTKKEGKKK